MRKRSRWYSSLVVFGLLVIMIGCSGCKTWKGFLYDVQHLSDLDKEFQENYW